MTEIFKALSDLTRLRLLALVWDKEYCVCEFAELLEQKQSNISRHLSILKQAGILERLRQDRHTLYRVSRDFIDGNRNLTGYLEERFRRELVFRKDRSWQSTDLEEPSDGTVCEATEEEIEHE